MKRRILFEADAFEEFNEWAKSDRKIYNKIAELIKDIERNPNHRVALCGYPQAIANCRPKYRSR